MPGIGPTTVRRYESPSPLWDKEKSRPVHTTFVAKLLRLFYPKSEEKKSNQTDFPHYSQFIFPNVKVKQENEKTKGQVIQKEKKLSEGCLTTRKSKMQIKRVKSVPLERKLTEWEELHPPVSSINTKNVGTQTDSVTCFGACVRDEKGLYRIV